MDLRKRSLKVRERLKMKEKKLLRRGIQDSLSAAFIIYFLSFNIFHDIPGSQIPDT